MSIINKLEDCTNKGKGVSRIEIDEKGMKDIFGEEFEKNTVEVIGRTNERRLYFEENSKFYYVDYRLDTMKKEPYILEGLREYKAGRYSFFYEVNHEDLRRLKNKLRRLEQEASVYKKILNHKKYRIQALFE